MKTRHGGYHRFNQGCYMLNVMTLKENGCSVHDPVYFEQAWDHKNEVKRNKWRQAIEKERDDMMDRKVWSVVENVGQKYKKYFVPRFTKTKYGVQSI